MIHNSSVKNNLELQLNFQFIFLPQDLINYNFN